MPMILSFQDIIGQTKAKELLRRSASQGRLSHAFLFKGPMGVGKKTVARAFAASLNCRQPRNLEPCGRCSSCLKFRSGNHPDFLLIEPEGAAIKIRQIRELKRSLAFPPFEAEHRIVLLADIHTMRREAANSLLKTLEEPPAGTILILTGDEAAQLLPTIVSRCQVIPFFSLPLEAVAQALLAEEDIAPDAAATLAAVAEGSLGRARLLRQKNLLAVRQEVVDTLLELDPGRPGAVEAVFSLAETAAALKGDLDELLDLCRAWLRDLMLFKLGISNQSLNQDLAPCLAVAGRRWNVPQLFDKLHRIDRAKRQLARNCNRALVCEVLFFGLL